MTGLLQKIWMEVRWPVLWFSLGLCAVMSLLTVLLPKVLGNIHQMFDKMPIVKPLLTALLGVDPGDQVSAQLSQAFLWVHPTVLTLLWAHEVMYCSRMPAGEIVSASLPVADFYGRIDWLADFRHLHSGLRLRRPSGGFAQRSTGHAIVGS